MKALTISFLENVEIRAMSFNAGSFLRFNFIAVDRGKGVVNLVSLWLVLKMF